MLSIPVRHRTPLRLTLLATALAAALPASAGIVTSGEFSPNPLPVNGTVAGILRIGPTTTGSVTVNGGSLLTADGVWIANTNVNTGVGTLTVQGSGSKVDVTWAGGANLDVGGSGTGTLELLDGGVLQYGPRNQACGTSCRINISNGAGSTGTLLVRGIGAALDTDGGVTVGLSTVIRPNATTGETRTYGILGATSTGTARVEAGATATSNFLAVGVPGGGNAQTGTERSVGSVIVDGIGSAWGIVRNAAQAGGQTLLRLATGNNTNGSLEVRNGGVVSLNGASDRNQLSGVAIAGQGPGQPANGATGSILVTGAGSRLTFEEAVGFINAGRNTGATATLRITDGGFVGSANVASDRGLTFVNVGRFGGTGTLEVAGPGSQLLISGRNPDPSQDSATNHGAGAFMHIGRTETFTLAGMPTTRAGTGTAGVTGGGRITIDNSTLAIAPRDIATGQATTVGQTGFMVGRGNGAQGQLTVSGANSVVEVFGGNGLASYQAIGRDGGSGTLMVSAGGRVTASSGGSSTPNAGTYLPGDVMLFEVGRRVDGSTSSPATTGTLTVTGTGSTLALGGTRDHLLIVGRGYNASGTLNIQDGGRVETRGLLVGDNFQGSTGAIGTLNMNGGTLVTDGLLNGGPGVFAAGQPIGGGVGIGRNGGTGTANIGNASIVTIGSALVPRSALSIGGSGTAPGGIGTVNVSGGSTVTISGPDSGVFLGRAGGTGTGIGTLNITDAGSAVSASGAGARVIIGTDAGSVGSVNVGAGASLSAASRIGVAHDGAANTGGSGTLTVNGTVTTGTLYNGSAGVINGSGTINASVVNLGTINPGNSPGKLTINGDYDGTGGTIVLEVASNGSGGFLFDEIVFGSAAQVLLGGSTIQFDFLGGANPEAFAAAGLFDLDTFFDAYGSASEIAGLFDNVAFEASGTGVPANFRIDAAALIENFEGNGVPLPPSLALVLAGLAALGAVRRRTAAAA